MADPNTHTATRSPSIGSSGRRASQIAERAVAMRTPRHGNDATSEHSIHHLNLVEGGATSSSAPAHEPVGGTPAPLLGDEALRASLEKSNISVADILTGAGNSHMILRPDGFSTGLVHGAPVGESPPSRVASQGSSQGQSQGSIRGQSNATGSSSSVATGDVQQGNGAQEGMHAQVANVEAGDPAFDGPAPLPMSDEDEDFPAPIPMDIETETECIDNIVLDNTVDTMVSGWLSPRLQISSRVNEMTARVNEILSPRSPRIDNEIRYRGTSSGRGRNEAVASDVTPRDQNQCNVTLTPRDYSRRPYEQADGNRSPPTNRSPKRGKKSNRGKNREMDPDVKKEERVVKTTYDLLLTLGETADKMLNQLLKPAARDVVLMIVTRLIVLVYYLSYEIWSALWFTACFFYYNAKQTFTQAIANGTTSNGIKTQNQAGAAKIGVQDEVTTGWVVNVGGNNTNRWTADANNVTDTKEDKKDTLQRAVSGEGGFPRREKIHDICLDEPSEPEHEYRVPNIVDTISSLREHMSIGKMSATIRRRFIEVTKIRGPAGSKNDLMNSGKSEKSKLCKNSKNWKDSDENIGSDSGNSVSSAGSSKTSSDAASGSLRSKTSELSKGTPPGSPREYDAITVYEAAAKFSVTTFVIAFIIWFPMQISKCWQRWLAFFWQYYKYDVLLPYCRNTFSSEMSLLVIQSRDWRSTLFLAAGVCLVTFGIFEYAPRIGRQRTIRKLEDDVRKIRQLAHEEVDKLCCICLENPKSVLLIPCNHVCICGFCLSALRRPACPICNCRVQRYMDKVYC